MVSLLSHAVQNTWVDPASDTQTIIKPIRLTPKGGAINNAFIGGYDVPLPVQSKPIHLFSIGVIEATTLGLTPYAVPNDYFVWVSIAGVMNSSHIFTDIYTLEGYSIPRSETWYLQSPDGYMVIAVLDNPKLPVKYGADDLYLRIYNGLYLQGLNTPVQKIKTETAYPRNISEIAAFQNAISTLPPVGYVFKYINGVLVNDITLFNALPYDTLEYVHDTSVISANTYLINNFGLYSSTLDNERKCLISHDSTDNQRVEHMDDEDYYVLAAGATTGSTIGLYYNKNKLSSVRQLTHRDKGLSVQDITYLTGVLSTRQPTAAYTTCRLLIVKRNPGTVKAIPKVATYIRDLYRLSLVERNRVMAGVNTLIPEWSAGQLEVSGYAKLFGLDHVRLSTNAVATAYGYDGVVDAIAAPITKLTNGGYPVPFNWVNGATVFEYDNNGLYLGMGDHSGGDLYMPLYAGCAMVEWFPVFTTNVSHSVYGIDHVPIPPMCAYRVYVCTRHLDGSLDNKWRDVTGTNQYTVVNGTVVWANLSNDQYIMVRPDTYAIVDNILPPVVNGVLQFDLTESVTINGATVITPIYVPYGTLEIILNGHTLIEGLDYRLIDQTVYIVSKTYISYTTPNDVVYRYHGFCFADLTRLVYDESGFSDKGKISDNAIVAARLNTNQKVVVGGGIMRGIDAPFQDLNGTGIVPNGRPYAVYDITPSLYDTLGTTYLTMRDVAITARKKVGGYLTGLLATPPVAFNPIVDKVAVYSPFLSGLIDDLVHSRITLPDITKVNDTEIMLSLAGREPVLVIDPITTTLTTDNRYVVIHPTIANGYISLDAVSAAWLERVVSIYAKGLVDTSAFINII